MTAEMTERDHEAIEVRIRSVVDASTDRFDELLKIAGLDPLRDLRFMDWSGVDFSGCDLRGYDFTGANLTGCQFDAARIAGAQFDAAQMERRAVVKAEDWSRYLTSWRKAANPTGDRHLPDLAVFSDAPFAPELVAVPAGELLMGSPESEEGRLKDEGPQHPVRIGYRLAIGRYPVTFAEYDHYCEATRAQKPSDESWGRGRRPVINVSWHDAQAYCAWLAKETGRGYRLPSEAEWEFACRAGTTTRYAFGNDITIEQASFDARVGKTTEVGAYPPNGWGLHDMHGNVWEWVEDVWHEDYKGTPVDGSAWVRGGDQGWRVLRGGSWYNNWLNVRSVYRSRSNTGFRNYDIGFRVARTLTP